MGASNAAGDAELLNCRTTIESYRTEVLISPLPGWGGVGIVISERLKLLGTQHD